MGLYDVPLSLNWGYNSSHNALHLQYRSKLPSYKYSHVILLAVIQKRLPMNKPEKEIDNI